MLGGEIRVKSEPGQGSTFTLYLPRRGPNSVPADDANIRQPADDSWAAKVEGQSLVADDKENIQEGDRVLAVVAFDPAGGQRVLRIGRDQGFKIVIDADPDSAFGTIRDYSPDAVALVGDDEAWLILDHLKHDLRTSHIPVHVIGDRKDRQRALNLGAWSFIEVDASDDLLARSVQSLKEFIERKVKSLLIVEDDENQRKALEDLIGDGDVQTVAVSTGDQALEALTNGSF